MKNECAIVQDLLPLYEEQMLHPDTARFVQDHLSQCRQCQERSQQEFEGATPTPDPDPAPLHRLRKKLVMQKRRIVAFTAIVVAAVVLSALAVLGAPEYFPYDESLLCVETAPDGSILIQFDPRVTDYEIVKTEDDSLTLTAWTTPFDRNREHTGHLALTLPGASGTPKRIYYASNNGSEDMVVYGSVPAEHRVTLPRLSLSAYLQIMLVCFIVLAAVGIFLAACHRRQVWLEELALYPLGYALSHWIVMGTRSASYCLQRDLGAIILISVCLFLGMRLVYKTIWEYFRNKAI